MNGEKVSVNMVNTPIFIRRTLAAQKHFVTPLSYRRRIGARRARQTQKTDRKKTSVRKLFIALLSLRNEGIGLLSNIYYECPLNLHA